MSRLYLRLTPSRRSTNSCSSASEVANRMICHQCSEGSWRFAPQFVIHLEIHPRVSLITIYARMLNKYGERTQRCRTPFLTRNHSDSVSATLTLASCFLYSLASKSIKCTGYLMSITQSLSWEIESNALLKSTKHIWSGCWCSRTCLVHQCSEFRDLISCPPSLSETRMFLCNFRFGLRSDPLVSLVSNMIRRRILLACETTAIVL